MGEGSDSERIKALEVKVDALLLRLNKAVERLDELYAVANMGKGMWALVLRTGAVLMLAATIYMAIKK